MAGTTDDSFVFQVGRMSDLCQPVHERYKLAITKVMGKNLHALVVKNKETALEVINHLKMFHAPPEVILPLDTIKVYPIQGKLRFVNGKLDIFPTLLLVVLCTVFFVGGDCRFGSGWAKMFVLSGFADHNIYRANTDF
jgi:hypothetical protein